MRFWWKLLIKYITFKYLGKAFVRSQSEMDANIAVNFVSLLIFYLIITEWGKFIRLKKLKTYSYY